MDDQEPKPMTDADVSPSPADAGASAAAPVKQTGDAATAPEAGDKPATPAPAAREQIRQGAQRLTSQAGDTARGFVDQGKARATDALGQLTQLLQDAATQVDERLGGSYGDYARQAAGHVQGLADGIESRSADDLLDEARAFVRRSPGVAIGVAATLGFAVARLASAGLDHRAESVDA